MNNYDIFDVEEQDIKLVIVMKTSESPFDYATDIQEQLRNMGFVGTFFVQKRKWGLGVASPGMW